MLVGSNVIGASSFDHDKYLLAYLSNPSSPFLLISSDGKTHLSSPTIHSANLFLSSLLLPHPHPSSFENEEEKAEKPSREKLPPPINLSAPALGLEVQRGERRLHGNSEWNDPNKRKREEARKRRYKKNKKLRTDNNEALRTNG